MQLYKEEMIYQYTNLSVDEITVCRILKIKTINDFKSKKIRM